jgi:hypothetical protein
MVVAHGLDELMRGGLMLSGIIYYGGRWRW